MLNYYETRLPVSLTLWNTTFGYPKFPKYQEKPKFIIIASSSIHFQAWYSKEGRATQSCSVEIELEICIILSQ